MHIVRLALCVRFTAGFRALIAAFCLLFALGCNKTVRVSLDRSELQQFVSARFPIQRQVLLSKVTLENPQVLLTDGSDRIGLEVVARVQTPMLPEATATVGASGKLSYRADQRAFYLDSPKIERLDVNGVPAQYLAQARAPIESVASEAFAAIPIYQLTGKDLEEVTAQHLLRSVSVKDAKLDATFGL